MEKSTLKFISIFLHDNVKNKCFFFIFRDAAIQFHLEAGYISYFYYEPSRAKEHFASAHKKTSLNVELTGKNMKLCR